MGRIFGSCYCIIALGSVNYQGTSNRMLISKDMLIYHQTNYDVMQDVCVHLIGVLICFAAEACLVPWQLSKGTC
jgi:hypothetical protein